MQIQAAGLAWIRPEHYDSFRALLPDSNWPSTYSAWLQKAEQLFQKVKDSGVRPVKVYIDPDQLIAFCAAAGRRVDSKGLRDLASRGAVQALRDADRSGDR